MRISEANLLFFTLLPFYNLSTTNAWNIVHVGDSFSSGNGARGPGFAYNYQGVKGCFRSPTNWGQEMANQLGATSYENRACSGGLVEHITNTRSLFGNATLGDGSCPDPEFPPEESYGSPSGGVCPRFVEPQVTGIDTSTDVVLVGVGGNDFNFAEIVLGCFIPNERSHSRCTTAMNFATNHLSTYESELEQALLDIETELREDAIVVVVAYPHITMGTDYTATCCGFCCNNRDIIDGLRNLALQVDDAQRSAVMAANSAVGRDFVFFYDETKELFEGHEPHPDRFVENPDRWIWEWGLTTSVLLREETYHLRPRGHLELGIALEPFVSALLPSTTPPTTPMPQPTTPPPTTPAPVPSPTPPGATLNPTPAPVVAPTFNPPPTSPGDDNDDFCFSEMATVIVEGQARPIYMKDLQVGDRVLTGNHNDNRQQYATVYAFAHRHETKPVTYLQITTTASPSSPLEITGAHMLYVDGKRGPVRADSIHLDDNIIMVSPSKTVASVTSIQTIQRQGLYAPLTTDGTIVVNNVLASNYVSMQTLRNTNRSDGELMEIVASGGQQHWRIPFLTQAEVIHWYMTPMRLLCPREGWNFCQHDNNQEGMPSYVQWGLELVAWGEAQNVWMQLLLLTGVLLTMGSLRAVELLFTKHDVLDMVLLIGALVVLTLLRKRSHPNTVSKTASQGMDKEPDLSKPLCPSSS